MNLNIGKNQNGRSMIEMLGVLAIIGILSIGGMLGYSKAIDRYRINETINQVTYIVQNTRDLFKSQKDYSGLSNEHIAMSDSNSENRILVEKTKIFPDSLIKNSYKNLFGGSIYFKSIGKYNGTDRKAFILGMYGIPQEACIELATRDWNAEQGLVALKIKTAQVTDLYNINLTYLGKCTSQYADGTGVICAADIPLTPEQAVILCYGEKSNDFLWKFY